MVFVNQQAVFFDKMLELRVLAVKMLDGLISSILTAVFSWESKAISLTSCKR
jgi:hypothetical protein